MFTGTLKHLKRYLHLRVQVLIGRTVIEVYHIARRTTAHSRDAIFVCIVVPYCSVVGLLIFCDVYLILLICALIPLVFPLIALTGYGPKLWESEWAHLCEKRRRRREGYGSKSRFSGYLRAEGSDRHTGIRNKVDSKLRCFKRGRPAHRALECRSKQGVSPRNMQETCA